MKKRDDETRRCETTIREALVRAGVRDTLVLRQLNEGREEVTGYCRRRD